MSHSSRALLLAGASSLLLALPSVALAQGSLTPPGAPAPTMKTLDQIEPRTDIQRVINPLPSDANYHFIISTPGSYYLSANLGVTKANGIHVTVAGVTLDLNGFEISRTSGAGGDGITIGAAAHRCTVRNGSLAGFGIGIRVFGARAGAFSALAVSACSSFGLLSGEAWEIVDCKAHDNAATGINASTGSTLRNCAASNNGGSGIITGSACTLKNCAAFSNTGTNGIQTGFGCTLHNCTARSNTSPNTSSAGISVSSESTVVACVATNNATTNATPTGDTAVGFRIGPGSLVKDCVAQGNTGDGIRAQGQCVITGNQCDANGSNGDGAGIHVTSSDNRIEANNVTANDRGIDVDAAGNLIIKNSAAGNTANYDIVANNVFGAIIDRTAPASAAVTGNSAASSAGTTDPWANFSY